MAKLYIDESGNTGETLGIDGRLNFMDQPYYVLAGIMLDPETERELSRFISELKSKHKFQGIELKAKGLYETKPRLISELIDFVSEKKIPVFVEIMDKVFYLNIQLVEYFILPYYAFKLSDEVIHMKRYLATYLGNFLIPAIYQQLLSAVKTYTHESLELFYDQLIAHFASLKTSEGEVLSKGAQQTKSDFLIAKEDDPENALRNFLPLPDENPKKRLIHLLPNYNAFTNLIARAEKYRTDKSLKPVEIVHDEQKQFDVIFQSAFELMKVSNKVDSWAKETLVSKTASYNISRDTTLKFEESKLSQPLQTADLLAGFVMRFWSDFIKQDYKKNDLYLPSVKKLIYPNDDSSEGINFVVPDDKHFELIHYHQFRRNK